MKITDEVIGIAIRGFDFSTLTDEMITEEIKEKTGAEISVRSTRRIHTIVNHLKKNEFKEAFTSTWAGQESLAKRICDYMGIEIPKDIKLMLEKGNTAQAADEAEGFNNAELISRINELSETQKRQNEIITVLVKSVESISADISLLRTGLANTLTDMESANESSSAVIEKMNQTVNILNGNITKIAGEVSTIRDCYEITAGMSKVDKCETRIIQLLRKAAGDMSEKVVDTQLTNQGYTVTEIADAKSRLILGNKIAKKAIGNGSSAVVKIILK